VKRSHPIGTQLLTVGNHSSPSPQSEVKVPTIKHKKNTAFIIDNILIYDFIFRQYIEKRENLCSGSLPYKVIL
jgi:hypothetical protein